MMQINAIAFQSLINDLDGNLDNVDTVEFTGPQTVKLNYSNDPKSLSIRFDVLKNKWIIQK